MSLTMVNGNWIRQLRGVNNAARFVVVGLACGLLSGCGGVELGLAQSAVNGVTYLATGKSADDHALSAVANQDCKMARILEDGPVCRPHPKFQSDATLADRGPEPSSSAYSAAYGISVSQTAGFAASRPMDQPLDQDTSGLAAGASDAGLAAGDGVTAADLPGTGFYLVLATFPREADAWVVANELERLNTHVSQSFRHGYDLYRVVAGPVDLGQLPALESRVFAAGIDGAWPIELCRDRPIEPPCANRGAEGPSGVTAPASAGRRGGPGDLATRARY